MTVGALPAFIEGLILRNLDRNRSKYTFFSEGSRLCLACSNKWRKCLRYKIKN